MRRPLAFRAEAARFFWSRRFAVGAACNRAVDALAAARAEHQARNGGRRNG